MDRRYLGMYIAFAFILIGFFIGLWVITYIMATFKILIYILLCVITIFILSCIVYRFIVGGNE